MNIGILHSLLYVSIGAVVVIAYCLGAVEAHVITEAGAVQGCVAWQQIIRQCGGWESWWL